jgi:hypothetical protein
MIKINVQLEKKSATVHLLGPRDGGDQTGKTHPSGLVLRRGAGCGKVWCHGRTIRE